MDIFHQKLIIDTTIDNTAVAKMKDFRKKGIWYLRTINEVVKYRIEAVSMGMMRSLLSSR
jgi:adenylosuccinate synthase